MLRDLSWTVQAADSASRLDRLLFSLCPSSTRAFCKKAIAERKIFLNGKPAVKGAKVHAGDSIHLVELFEAKDNQIRPNPEIPVDLLYEDKWLIAVNKPAGISVQPLFCTETDTLMNGIIARYPEIAAVGDQPLMGGALHRIDTGTSGLVLAARDPETFLDIRNQFSVRAIKKIYFAWVEGIVTRSGHLVHDLAHQPDVPYCRMVDARKQSHPDVSLHAETDFMPVSQANGKTLLEVTIRTGVTHQIRAQLSLAGMPIVNDTLYGATPIPGLSHHLLHAYSVDFLHPATQKPLHIIAPFPALFQRLAGETQDSP